MKYRTIVADPPWAVKRGSQYKWRSGQPSGARQDLDYSTMTVGQIAAVPVRDMAQADAHLFLWTTQGFLYPARDVARAWGFSYSCTLVWCKAPHGWGPGGAFQSTVEFVLYCRRGKPTSDAQIERQWWEWPRGRHSAKPEAFFDMIQASFPGPFVELFARRGRLGWDYWGDESLQTAELPEVASGGS